VRAIVLHQTGGPEVLRLEEWPEPEPAEGEVLVRVEAAGVNHRDLNLRAGGATGLPRVLGSDAGGATADGTRVLVTGGRGTYAELTVAKDENVFPIPEGLSAAAAAALGAPYRTAWWSIVDVGGLVEGGTLLVQAGSSATGQACIDIGRAFGARVYATASERKLERIAALGAEPLAYDDPRVAELAADVVFDPVGASTFARSVEALAADGRLVTPGAVGDPHVSFDVWTLMEKRGRIVGTGSAPIVPETIRRLIDLAAAGQLRPVIDRELPLEQAAEAHRAIEARETFGKVILRP
jgi:NADPH:quinone reductase-like Zn-dependent oxidoreductase